MKVLVTGSEGFIGGYIVQELIGRGYSVIGLDNRSKYGPVFRSYSDHPGYRFVEGDAKDVGLLKTLISDCDHFIAGAAMIGGISYFHQYAYDLLAENERITASAFDAAIWSFKTKRLRKVTVLSSSMVFENAEKFPTQEGEELQCRPPSSSYGFQKLSTEYFSRAAYAQHGLPYTIIRPFNCIGIGEGRAMNAPHVMSGNVRLAMSHVLPDLVLKCLKGQNPIHLLGDGSQVRHYTYGGDVARGIRMTLETKDSEGQDFNISTRTATTVLELAKKIWVRVNEGIPFSYVCDPAFPHDVKMRIPDVSKAMGILGFEAHATLESVIDEIISWIRLELEKGRI